MKLRDIRDIFRLLGEVREIGADPQVWRPHMVRRLRKLLGAQIVISSEIHFRKARGGPLRVLDIGWGCDGEAHVWRIENDQESDPQSYWVRAGNVLAGDEEVPLVAIEPTRAVYGGTSFILSQCALPHAAAVDQLGIHRAWGDQPFTRSEHKLARLFHVELARLWRADALRRAGDPRTTLPPRLKQTLDELLAGASEKQIALKLELSQHTVHNYVKALHRRFDVNSRGELLAKVGATESFRPKLSVMIPTPREKK